MNSSRQVPSDAPTLTLSITPTSPAKPNPGTDTIASPSPVSPSVTVARQCSRHLASLLRAENGAMVDFLLALVEFDGRRLWEDLGFGSLFDYLHRELAMSAGSAFYRTTAVRLLHFFPEIVDPLRDGRLCVSSLPEVAKVLTRANYEEVLPQFFHRSTREAKEVSAALAPNTAPPRRDVVTVLTPRVVSRNVTVATSPAASLTPRPRAVDSKAAVGTDVAPTSSPPTSHEFADFAVRPTQPFHSLEVGAVAPDLAAEQQGNAGVQSTAVKKDSPSIEADRIEPLTADLRRLHFTVSREFLRKLDAARALLSHRHPSGRAGDVLEAALDLLLDRHAARKTVRRRETGTAHSDRNGVANRTRGDTARPSRPAAVRPDSSEVRIGDGSLAGASVERDPREYPQGGSGAR